MQTRKHLMKDTEAGKVTRTMYLTIEGIGDKSKRVKESRRRVVW